MYFAVFLLVNESPNSPRKTSAFMNNFNTKTMIQQFVFRLCGNTKSKRDPCCLLDRFRVLEFSASELPVAIVGD